LLIIHGINRIDPSIRDEWVASAQQNAERCRQEKGNLGYVYGADLSDPELVHTIEKWESAEAFQAHVDDPAHAERVALNRRLGTTAHEVKTYEVSDARDYVRPE
jgi:quinol monooxygenase YgiN